MSLIGNIRKRGWQDILNPRKWFIFGRYLTLRTLKKQYEELSVPEYLDQLVLRMQHPGCRPCAKGDQCVHCECKMPEGMYDKSNQCSQDNWAPMYPPDIWNEIKHRYKIDKDYLKQIKKYGKIIKFKDED